MNAIIDGMPEAEYRALPGLSGTGVAKLLASPADYAYDLANPEPPNASMSLGTLVHAMVLTPDVPLTVGVNPFSYNGQRKEWTARKAELEADGLTPIGADVMARAELMRDAVMGNPIAARLLTAPGHSEVTVTGEHRGAPLKGRIDRMPEVGPIVDVKTAREVAPDFMARFIGTYGVATQLAHYALLMGNEIARPYVIAVRNSRRPAVAVYQIGEPTWQVAVNATRRAWDAYAECVKTGMWPDPNAEQIGDLELPAWSFDALEDIDEIEVTR